MSADNDINRKLKDHSSQMKLVNTWKLYFFCITNMNKNNTGWIQLEDLPKVLNLIILVHVL